MRQIIFTRLGRRFLLLVLQMRHIVVCGKCILAGNIHDLENRLFLRKFDLGFCGMHVDVDRRQRQIQEKRTRRIFAGDDCIAIGLFHCSLHKTALDIAAIDEKVLHGTVGTSGVRLDNVAVHGHTVALGHRHFNHIGSHFLAEYAEHRCNQLALAVRREYLLAVANERERNLRMGERRMLYYAENVTRLGEVLFEKLHASRCVEEQVAHNDCCAFRTAGFLLCLNLTGFQMQVQTRNRTCLTRKQINARNRRNRSQCFTAETQCADGVQIFLGAQLAGRVAAESHWRVFCRHAAAVIRNTQIGNAAVFDLHRNAGRTCVNRILDQLLRHRGRPFNNLSCRDQIRKMRR